MVVRNLSHIRIPKNVIRGNQEGEFGSISMTGGSIFSKMGKFFKKAGRWAKKNVLAPVVEKAIPWVAKHGIGKVASMVENIPVVGDIARTTGATDWVANQANKGAQKFGKKVGKKIRGNGMKGKGTKSLTPKQIMNIINSY